MFTDMLQQWSRQASQRSTSIGWLLRGYDPRSLTERLRCDEPTVCWLRLYGRPAGDNWDRGVRAIARDLGLDTGRLDGVLREAEASHRRRPTETTGRPVAAVAPAGEARDVSSKAAGVVC